jgi:hypothetical protein
MLDSRAWAVRGWSKLQERQILSEKALELHTWWYHLPISFTFTVTPLHISKNNLEIS